MGCWDPRCRPHERPRAQVVPAGGGRAAPGDAGASRGGAGAGAAFALGGAAGGVPGAAPGPAPPALCPHSAPAPLRPPGPPRCQGGGPPHPLPLPLPRGPAGLRVMGGPGGGSGRGGRLMLGGGGGTLTPGSSRPPRRGSARVWGQVGVGSRSPGTPTPQRVSRRPVGTGRSRFGGLPAAPGTGVTQFPWQKEGVQGWGALRSPPRGGLWRGWRGCGGSLCGVVQMMVFVWQ